MKVLQINTVFPYGSTGKICNGIAKKCKEEKIQNYIAYAHSESNRNERINEIEISSWLDHHVHNRLGRLTMEIGSFSFFHTKYFLRKVRKIKPDVIHLHNLHGNYINLRLLFDFIREEKIPVVWTLHDCWAFTGYCTHFSAVNCEKWKAQCYECPNRNLDSITLLDRSKEMYRKKKRMFTELKKITIITPSNWLKQTVCQSFLKKYDVRVINNGIDLNIFVPSKSDFRTKYKIRNNQFVLLGVASIWDHRKGLDEFLKLSQTLDDSYKIVLVGTTDEMDKSLPKTIISIHRTHNQKELAEIYSGADLFVNPTIEDNFPTVNIEALACGTPVLTYRTGGSPEIIDCSCGSVVPQGDVEALKAEIIRIRNELPYTKEACVDRARKYDMNDRFQRYIDLYKEMLNE